MEFFLTLPAFDVTAYTFLSQCPIVVIFFKRGLVKTKIFGIGLPKTGTKTLGSCLKHLGCKHLSGRLDLLSLYRKGRIFDVFEKIDQFESFEDEPYPYMFKELFFRYGDNAKFILTRRRDPQAWLESLKRHCLVTPRSAHWHLLGFGYAYPHGAETEHLEIYERHLLDVRLFFRRHRAEDKLLEICWESGDGWPQLCKFLGVETPDLPLPHSNRAEDTLADPTVIATHLARVKYQLTLLGLEVDIMKLDKFAIPENRKK